MGESEVNTGKEEFQGGIRSLVGLTGVGSSTFNSRRRFRNLIPGGWVTKFEDCTRTHTLDG